MSTVATEQPLSQQLADSPTGTRRYAVRSIWRTLQGEGAHVGRPAVFVRMAGCNLWSGHEKDRERDAARTDADCPIWCDTDFRKEGAVKLSADTLAAEARRIGPGIDFVVLTGGEPLLQADPELIEALHTEGFMVACETNGTVSLSDRFGAIENGPDWVVCSPKLPPDRLVLEVCDELKLIVPDYRPSKFTNFVERVRLQSDGRRYLWLQPEDGPRLAEATRRAVSLALDDPRWRVSVQTHKILGVD